MQADIDGKKLSVKCYANKRLKPTWDAKAGKLYPLYVQVIYDKQSTKFRANQVLTEVHGTILVDEEMNIVAERFPNNQGLVELISDRVINAVTYELDKSSKTFSVKGLANRLFLYYEQYGTWIQRVILPYVMNYCADFVPYKVYMQMQDKGFELGDIINYLPDLSEIPQSYVDAIIILKFFSGRPLNKTHLIDIISKKNLHLFEGIAFSRKNTADAFSALWDDCGFEAWIKDQISMLEQLVLSQIEIK